MAGKPGRPRTRQRTGLPPLAAHSYDHDKQRSVGRQDGWNNWQTGQGTGADKTQYSFYQTDFRIDDDQLSGLYYGNDLAKLVIDGYVDESFRIGYELNIPDDDDNTVKDALDAWKPALDTAARDLLRWSRLFGGGAIYLDVEDGLSLLEPLNVKKIKKINSLRVFDRRYVWPLGYDTDPTSPTYWLPEFYGFGGSLAGTLMSPRVHHSRLLRAVGLEADRREAQYLMWWGHSVLQPVYQVLLRFGLSEQAVVIMMQDATQFIFYVKGLIQAIASDDANAIQQRYQMIDMQRGVGKALLLDAGMTGTDSEKTEKLTTPFTGVSDQLQFFKERVAAAARMPVSVLFGTGAGKGGIGNNGEGDLRIWHAGVQAYQAREVEPVLRRLYALVGAVEGLDVSGIKFQWGPLYEPTAAEDAAIRFQIAQADNIYLTQGVVRPEEVAISRWGSGKFNADMTAVDIPMYKAAIMAAPAPQPAQPIGAKPGFPAPGTVPPAGPGQPAPGVTSNGPVTPPAGVATEKGTPVAAPSVTEKPEVNASNSPNAPDQPMAAGEYGGSNSAATEPQMVDVTGRGSPKKDLERNPLPPDVSGTTPADTPAGTGKAAGKDPTPQSSDAGPAPQSDPSAKPDEISVTHGKTKIKIKSPRTDAWSDAAREASILARAASAASVNAEKEGTPEAHRAAADAHKRAATAYRASADLALSTPSKATRYKPEMQAKNQNYMAASHDALAAAHEAKAEES
jgi:uncharacterized protein